MPVIPSNERESGNNGLKKSVIPLVVFLISLTVYAFTLSPYVHLEDDGAFILSAFFNGTAHPPGYPLYTLISHAFTLVDISTVAARVHFVSAFFGAITASCIYGIIRLLTGNAVSAWAASLVFAFSVQFWSQAIIGEVYTLNTAIFFAVLYCLLQACSLPSLHETNVSQTSQWPARHYLAMAALLFGFGLANHWPLMLLSAPGLLLVALPCRRAVFRHFPLLVLLLIMGLSPYGWMYFFGSNKGDFISFGEIKNLQELFFYISRKGYGDVDQSASAGWLDKWQYLQFFISQSVSQFTLPLWLCAVAGMVVLVRKHCLAGTGILAAMAGNSLLLVVLLGFDFEEFYQIIFMPYPLIAYGAIAIFLGVCIAFIIHHIHSAVLHRLVSIMLVLLPLFFLASNYNKVDRKHDSWAEDFAHAIYAVLPANAILFVNGDVDTGPFGYLHYIKKVRPDVALYQENGALYPNRLFHPYSAIPEQRQKILQQFIVGQTRPVYSTSAMKIGLPQQSMGVLWKINTSPDIPGLAALNAAVEQQLPVSAVNNWQALHKVMLAKSLMDYYGSHGILSQLPETELHHITSYFDLQVMYLDKIMAMYHNDLKPEYFLQLISSIDRSSGRFVKKVEKARYAYLKARIYIEIAAQPEKAIPFLLDSVSLNPQADNPAIKPLFEWYVIHGEHEKIKALSALTGVKFNYKKL